MAIIIVINEACLIELDVSPSHTKVPITSPLFERGLIDYIKNLFVEARADLPSILFYRFLKIIIRFPALF
jgi:hypothetical protein